MQELRSRARHSLRGLCGLKLPADWSLVLYFRHSLRGLCGLKYDWLMVDIDPVRSQPARAVWIEIYHGADTPHGGAGHSLRGLCGLKCYPVIVFQVLQSHSLRGLCGLKSLWFPLFSASHPSQPARAVWIEILVLSHSAANSLSQPARAVWIEMQYHHPLHQPMVRHSLRGLCGLKSIGVVIVTSLRVVTACEGCVD